MAKKVFVSRARVVKGERWHLDYTRIDVDTGQETRHRKDFDLNDIADLAIREEVANRLVKYLGDFIIDTRPRAQPAAPAATKAAATETVKGAMELALQIKLNLPRKNSHKGFKSHAKIFISWATERGYAHLPIQEFSRKHAVAFFDWLSKQREYRAATLNNYRGNLRGMWNEMREDFGITSNPWSAIKKRRKQDKLRRKFSPDERRIVAQAVQDQDYWLFRALLLQFFCYIRPVEIVRLKFKDFNLSSGIITIHEWVAKKWKKRYATIPASIMHYFQDGRFDGYAGHYYVFGYRNQELIPTTELVRDVERTMYKRHKKILRTLLKAGQLSDITGLCWYSWKDSGISEHSSKTSPIGTRDQAGHEDLKTTMIYYQSEQVVDEYKTLPNDLF